jgi:hypothetical protein
LRQVTLTEPYRRGFSCQILSEFNIELIELAMTQDDKLTTKIKKGIIKSGFPLEMKTSKILKNNGWNHSMCNYYLDFETNVYREYDIHAEKNINGIGINLYIECKKSDEKQVVLYSPQNKKILPFMDLYFKAFPKLQPYTNNIAIQKNVKEAFRQLPIFDKNYRLANGLIFCRGEKVEQDNSSFFNSLQGLIKQSIISGYDGLIETDFRMIFLYLLVYDGFIYELAPSESDDFSLKEIEYGQYSIEYHFRPQTNFDNLNQAFYQHMLKYGTSYIIEILKPSFLKEYLYIIESAIIKVDKNKMAGWGTDWPNIKIQRIEKNPNS